MPVVVDASVAAKWFVPEDHAEAAQQLLATADRRVAPELLAAEIGNMVWRKQRLHELQPEEAELVIQRFRGFDIHMHPISPLLAAAFAIAGHIDRTVYDSLYLALAERMDCSMVTADLRFHRAALAGGFGDRVVPLGEVR
jgi:predicted nucleic acid-binding protein